MRTSLLSPPRFAPISQPANAQHPANPKHRTQKTRVRVSPQQREKHFAALKAIAANRGGRCLSNAYKNSRSYMDWECQRGHRWRATASSVKSGSWCRTCSRTKLRLRDDPREQAIVAKLREVRSDGRATIEHMQTLASIRGGRCLSPAYRGSSKKLEWECAKGHTFSRTPASVKQGSWCLPCRGRKVHTIEEMQSVAQKRGGACLSQTYRSMRAPLKWRCETGHTWTACAETVLRGSWCPDCFGQSRGSIAKLRELARTRGGVCLSDTYVNNLHKLRWRCRDGHEWDARPMNIVMGTWCPTCANVARTRKGKRKRTLDEMQALAATRGGRCTSDAYANYATKLEWQCHAGHRWNATPKSVIHGSWCPQCAVEDRGTLQRCKELAGTRRGRCQSTKYVSGRLPLWWSCQQGHRFELSWLQAKGGQWCPTCAQASASHRAPTSRPPAHAQELWPETAASGCS